MQDSTRGRGAGVLLRSDVPVRVPDVGLDPRRPRARSGSTSRGGSSRSRRSTSSRASGTRGNGRGRSASARCASASLIRRELGNDELDRWYATVGHAFFYDGVKTHVPEVHAEVHRARTASTRRSSSARSPTDATLDRRARRSRRRGRRVRRARRADASCSSRATRCTGRSSCPRPTGDDAVALWELVRVDGSASRTCTSCATRRRTTISCTSRRASSTYLTTRDWKTVENPAP